MSGEGFPSNPGWKKGQLDTLTDWAVNNEANRPIITEYEPDSMWLWKQWDGTVWPLTIVPVVTSLVAGIGVSIGVRSCSETSWPYFAAPPTDVIAGNQLLEQLQGLNLLWEYQLTLATFILTFFTSEAYKHWRTVYLTTRAIQGRVNDICMLVTIGAATTAPNNEAAVLVERVTRLIKKSHTFFWAASPTCSNGFIDGEFEKSDIGPLLLSPAGLQELVEVGELTKEEVGALLESGLPPSQYAYVLLEWVGIYIRDGLASGLLPNATGGWEENILRQLTMLRGEYFNIGDYTAGRMPLAYVQLVQILVDSLVILAPFSLYSQVGDLSIALVPLLTLFFKGLLELSKSFLDPFGVEGYRSQNIRVDVLVSEVNFGAGNRWVKAAQSFPQPPTTTLHDSDLSL